MLHFSEVEENVKEQLFKVRQALRVHGRNESDNARVQTTPPEQNTKKRKQHSLLTVSPLKIDVDRARSWAEELRTAADAESPPCHETDTGSVAVRTKLKGPEGWRRRLRLEADRVEKMLGSVREGLLEGVLLDNARGERLQVYYPQMKETDFFKSAAPATRHRVTGHKLLELDISSAHPNIAYAAVRAVHTENTTPKLKRLATDPSGMVDEYVNNGYFKGRAEAKTAFLAALNQNEWSSCAQNDVLQTIRKERRFVRSALRVWGPISGYVQNIEEHVAKLNRGRSGKAVDILPYLLRAGETRLLEVAIQKLSEIGLHLAAPVSDALLLSSEDEISRTSAHHARALFVRSAATLGVHVKVKIDHTPLPEPR